MIAKPQLTQFFKGLAFALATTVMFTQCSDNDIIEDEIELTEDLKTSATSTTGCGCTYTIPSNKNLIDGLVLGIKPGAVICFSSANTYRNVNFQNIVGTATAPITIKNCGGPVTLNATGMSYGLKFGHSKYFRVTGGSTPGVYGIKVLAGHINTTFEALTTDFEVDHIESSSAGFSGIMAKTDPTCDVATTRGNFTMRNVSIHDNYIHDCAGEGLYVGNSFYKNGVSTSCGTKYPHEIHYLKIYNNKLKNTGWESIQVGCATVGAEIFDNTIENYGQKYAYAQNNGVQLGEGTGGKFYGNFIKSGPGHGLILLGLGDNVVYNNIIVNAGMNAIFCDDRLITGTGFKFINNTLVNPKQDGIRIYAEYLTHVVQNNIIVNPGSYSTYTYPRTASEAYVYKISSKMTVQMYNNYFTRTIGNVKFANYLADNYRLTSSSPTIDKGKSISTYGITKDFYKDLRLQLTNYDIGASEY
jgi:hypothetical protein